MIDYRGIEALYTVQELQSFEAAAKKLHITQSAVSQRIKGLETAYGEAVLVRTLPYQPTELGKQLIGHYKKICLLEGDLDEQLKLAKARPHISIALNRDSIETWFLELISEKEIFKNILLEIIADDQERTLDYLKNGRVSACLSTVEKAIMGGHAEFVGHMEYLLVATPAFFKEHFSGKSPEQCVLKATAVKFDQNDKLHETYLVKFFGMDSRELNFHVIPSVLGFKKFILSGYGYGLIPKIDIILELNKKELVPIYPDKTLKIPLYWHTFEVQSRFYQKFNEAMVRYIRQKVI